MAQPKKVVQGHETFLDALTAAGGHYRILWTSKRDRHTNGHDDLYYVVLYGKADENGNHPLVCGVILSNFENGGYEILYSSAHPKTEDDVNQILEWGEQRKKNAA